MGDEANIAENGGSYSEKLDEIRYDEDGNEISRINRGLIYSCFLLNPSSVAVKFDLSLVMTGYSSPSNAAVEPYSLLRVGIWHTRFAMDGVAEASLFKCFAADNTTVRYSGDGIRIEDDPREYVGESHLMRGTHSGETSPIDVWTKQLPPILGASKKRIASPVTWGKKASSPSVTVRITNTKSTPCSRDKCRVSPSPSGSKGATPIAKVRLLREPR